MSTVEEEEEEERFPTLMRTSPSPGSHRSASPTLKRPLASCCHAARLTAPAAMVFRCCQEGRWISWAPKDSRRGRSMQLDRSPRQKLTERSRMVDVEVALTRPRRQKTDVTSYMHM